MYQGTPQTQRLPLFASFAHESIHHVITPLSDANPYHDNNNNKRPKTPSNTSLFRATGRCRGRSDTAGGANGSKGTKGKGGILRRINRKTAVLVASLMLFAAMNSYAGKTIPKASEVSLIILCYFILLT